MPVLHRNLCARRTRGSTCAASWKTEDPRSVGAGSIHSEFRRAVYERSDPPPLQREAATGGISSINQIAASPRHV